MKRKLSVGVALVAACAPALGQSLYERPVATAPERAGAAEGEAPVGPVRPSAPQPLASVSLIAIEPPKPREFEANDLVTIIVSERSQFDREQSLDTEKKYDLDMGVQEFIDLVSLLELQVEASSDDRLPAIAVSSRQKFEGDGEYSKEDRLTDRIQAKVLEVKPNGTLVLEARRMVRTDEEETIVTLSGLCRTEDVTVANTIQSNQLYDLSLDVQNSGEMDRSSRKGIIPRVLETLFNF